MSNKRPVAVIVEGTRFESLSAAARFLNVKSVNVWRAAHTTGKLNNLSIELEDKSASQAKSLSKEYIKDYYDNKVKKKNKGKGKSCPIYCETLNKTFKNIKEAAKFAKVSDYTLSTKTELSGRFIDKEGNVYTRLKPMEHRNKNKTYPNTGEQLQFDRMSGYKINTAQIKEKEVTPVSILEDSAISFIKSGSYQQANKCLKALEVLTKED